MDISSPTIFVVDDDEAVRDSLGLLMESVGLPVETFDSCHAFLDAYTDERSGCLLLDIRMPGMNGIRLQAELLERQSTLPIIFITGHGDIPMAVEAIKRGAADFIPKPFRDQELLDRIDKILNDDKKSREDKQENEAINQRIASLTQRESEVMRLMVDGKANKVIAIELDISQRTIETHRARVMEKMQATSFAQLVSMVTRAESS